MISLAKLQAVQKELKNFDNRVSYAAKKYVSELTGFDIDYIKNIYNKDDILKRIKTDEDADKIIKEIKSIGKQEITSKFDKLAELKENGTSETEIDYIKRIFSDTHENYYRYITGELEPPQSDSKGFTEWVDKQAEKARANITNDNRDSDIREKELEDIDEYVARLKTTYTHNYVPNKKE